MNRFILIIAAVSLLTFNAHLRFSGDAVLMSVSKTSDGWYQHCVYYTPVYFVTKVTPVGQVCDRFAAL